MPLTFSHPAAVLPFRRSPVFSAMVTGSLMPDLPYFVHVFPAYGYAHTLQGWLLVCLPAGIAALWVFQRFLKWPAVELFPAEQRRKLSAAAHHEFAFGGAGRFALLCAAVLFGAATHIVWDGFTHQWGFAAASLPLLREAVDGGAFGPVPAYRILQHLSTLLGAAALALFYLRWMRTAPEAPPPEGREIMTPLARRWFWLLALALAAIAAVAAFFGSLKQRDYAAFSASAKWAFVAATNTMFAAWALWSAWYRLRHRHAASIQRG